MERAHSQTAGRPRKRRPRKEVVTTGDDTIEGLSRGVEPHLEARFKDFADQCSQFSQEVVERSGTLATMTKADHTHMNLKIARTVFGKWSVEIITYLYTQRQARFQEVKKALGNISARVLSLKLSRLEILGLVFRNVLDTRPPSVEYSLTERGLQIAKLGEPVFLYLRLIEGSLNPVST